MVFVWFTFDIWVLFATFDYRGIDFLFVLYFFFLEGLRIVGFDSLPRNKVGLDSFALECSFRN